MGVRLIKKYRDYILSQDCLLFIASPPSSESVEERTLEAPATRPTKERAKWLMLGHASSRTKQVPLHHHHIHNSTAYPPQHATLSHVSSPVAGSRPNSRRYIAAYHALAAPANTNSLTSELTHFQIRSPNPKL